MAEQRVYVTIADGSSAGSIVMQQGERVVGDHRTTNGATVEEVLAAFATAGYSAPDAEEPKAEESAAPEQAEFVVEDEEPDEEPEDE